MSACMTQNSHPYVIHTGSWGCVPLGVRSRYPKRGVGFSCLHDFLHLSAEALNVGLGPVQVFCGGLFSHTHQLRRVVRCRPRVTRPLRILF